MNKERVEELLRAVQAGQKSIEEGLAELSGWPIRELEHARLDTHRALRCGEPEVVFGEGKSPAELFEIAMEIARREGELLITRLAPEAAGPLLEGLPGAVYHERGRVLTLGLPQAGSGAGHVVVVSAGTADRPVAEEAELTTRMLGARVTPVRDVGVAGIHRLAEHLETLRSARAVIVVAGLEGALPSVIGGLIDRPLIAVPTSVGYGTGIGGLAALLTMLNSCAAGMTVVNIDNGFGAACAAARINRLEGVPRV